MNFLSSPRALNNVLLLDAAATLATVVLLVAGGGFLAGLLDLPESLLRGAGLILLPFVGFVVWVARRESPPAVAVWIIVVANLLWVIASAGLILGPWLQPNQLGIAFIAMQAVVVAGFAELQAIALWRRPVASLA
ncbi:hypothetical protein [Nisaea sediminum]|uniref:hypothetical protein n=1 Tax=Nisaea sediminum TaxID=2775867 RepID=UPI001868405D|nr:hypothetical protein [Nisaea sediminum]